MVNHPFHALEDGPTGDYRGTPSFVCPCGSDLLLVACIFDPETRLPGLILLDGMCGSCGSLLTVPCPVDTEVEA